MGINEEGRENGIAIVNHKEGNVTAWKILV